MGFIFNGTKIKKLRTGVGLGIVMMAKLCGISRQTLYEIEQEGRKRKPTVRVLEKIMARYPVSPEFFFVREFENKKGQEWKGTKKKKSTST